jgi:hypothetical protein
MPKLILSLAAVASLALPALAAAQSAPALPPLVEPVLVKPDAEGQKPRAIVAYAPYRYDDILWENDRTAHRIYGPALQAYEPPSTSGIDAWGKIVRWPFMERQLKTGKQHDFHGEGLDFYDVNTFRGAGGLGVWQDNKLWTSRNWKSYEILKTGGDVASFKVDYAPWPVDVDRKAWETRTFTLPLGTNFTRMVSTISSDKPGPLVVGIGISKRKATHQGAGGAFTKTVLGADRSGEGHDGHRPDGRSQGAGRGAPGRRQLHRPGQGRAGQAVRLLHGRGLGQRSGLPRPRRLGSLCEGPDARLRSGALINEEPSAAGARSSEVARTDG